MKTNTHITRQSPPPSASRSHWPPAEARPAAHRAAPPRTQPPPRSPRQPSHRAAPPRTQPPPRSRRRPSHDPPPWSSELGPVHGARLHVHCDGAGPTTVVLIAGFNASSGNAAAIETRLSPQTARVCSYDRFGRRARATRHEPRRPCATRSRRPPAALLQSSWRDRARTSSSSHSFGGPGADHLRLDVADRKSAGCSCSTPARRHGTPRSTRRARRLQTRAHVFQALWCGAGGVRPTNGEHLDAPTACAEVATIESSSGFPMIVATADHRSDPGLAARGRGSPRAACGTLARARLGVRSASSARLIVPSTTPATSIQLDRPDVVLDKIDELLP